jgi:hypothetical protein
MANSTRLFALLLLLGSVGACETPPSGGRSGVIEGVVLDGENPIAHAEIRIHPEGLASLVGVAVTNAAGRFTIVSLANTELFTEEPLHRDTVYNARIQVPGYWILDKTFEYNKGTESWEFALEAKHVDDLGDTNTFDADGDSTEGIGGGRGAVRRTGH